MKRTLLLLIVLLFGVYLYNYLHRRPPVPKLIHIQSRGLTYDEETLAKTVEEFFAEQGYNAPQPPLKLRGGEGELLTQGLTIDLNPPLNVTLIDAGNNSATTTDAITVNDFLSQKKIPLAGTDRVTPPLESFLAEGMKITIDRIVDLPETKDIDIPFPITRVDAPGMYYGREEVIVPGVVGKKEQNFLVTYKNGVEVKRKLLAEKILQKPKTEERQFGTLVDIEETAEGRASWYAYKNCLCAAHPFYDKGRYVRVTAEGTGKSVIVRINDRGPELDKHPDRVIDLDVVAYKELAGLGTGTILVRAELLRQ